MAQYTPRQNWYRELIRIRKEHPELCSPEAQTEFDEANGMFVMHRRGISVVCNFGRGPIQVEGQVLLAASGVVVGEVVERLEEVGLKPSAG